MPGTTVLQVFFNDGVDEDCFAAVITGTVGGPLNLLIVDSSDNVRVVNEVPQRAVADYGPEGGGDTYHL